MLEAGWVELKEADYQDKYEYPALYSNGIDGARAALDMSEGNQVLVWTVARN